MEKCDEEKELIDIVHELNCMLPEEMLDRGDLCFSLHSTGWQSAILFGEIYLWDNDNDERPWADDTDDYAISVKDYVILEFNKIVELLNKASLKEQFETD